MNHIIKRRGHREEFEAKKLYASIYAACLVLRVTDKEAESIADRVTRHVSTAITEKKEIDSHQLRQIAADHLHEYNPEAAYIYRHHRDIA